MVRNILSPNTSNTNINRQALSCAYLILSQCANHVLSFPLVAGTQCGRALPGCWECSNARLPRCWASSRLLVCWCSMGSECYYIVTFPCCFSCRLSFFSHFCYSCSQYPEIIGVSLNNACPLVNVMLNAWRFLSAQHQNFVIIWLEFSRAATVSSQILSE